MVSGCEGTWNREATTENFTIDVVQADCTVMARFKASDSEGDGEDDADPVSGGSTTPFYLALVGMVLITLRRKMD
jgi:hypothetical protein